MALTSFWSCCRTSTKPPAASQSSVHTSAAPRCPERRRTVQATRGRTRTQAGSRTLPAYSCGVCCLGNLAVLWSGLGHDLQAELVISPASQSALLMAPGYNSPRLGSCASSQPADLHSDTTSTGTGWLSGRCQCESGRRERRAACGLSHGSPARAARPRRPPAAAARGREQCQAPLAAARVPKNRRSALLSCILISLSGSRHNLAHELTTSDYAISTLTAADSRGAARHSLDMAWGSPPPSPDTTHAPSPHHAPLGRPAAQRARHLAVAQLGVVHADGQAARVRAARSKRVRLHADAAHLQLDPRRRARVRALACATAPAP